MIMCVCVCVCVWQLICQIVYETSYDMQFGYGLFLLRTVHFLTSLSVLVFIVFTCVAVETES